MSSAVPGSILGFEARSLSGDPIRFADMAGRVVLVVNTASECGFTPQYAYHSTQFITHESSASAQPL